MKLVQQGISLLLAVTMIAGGALSGTAFLPAEGDRCRSENTACCCCLVSEVSGSGLPAFDDCPCMAQSPWESDVPSTHRWTVVWNSSWVILSRPGSPALILSPVPARLPLGLEGLDNHPPIRVRLALLRRFLM